MTDPDGGTVDCSKVILNPALGHDDHAHETTEYPGCSGTISTDLLGGHPDGANLFYVLNARYTDNGGSGGAAPLTGYRAGDPAAQAQAGRVLQQPVRHPGRRPGGAESTKRVGDISNNDWIAFSPMSLSGISTVSYRVSSPSGGGSIELRADSPTGTLLATTTVPEHRRLGQLPVHDSGERRRASAGRTTLYMVFKSSTTTRSIWTRTPSAATASGHPAPAAVAWRARPGRSRRSTAAS